MFRGGRIEWRRFWGLYRQIPALRARDRLQSMMLANYMGAVMSPAKNRDVVLRRTWSETQREALGGAAPVEPPDEYELLTRRGRMRAGLN